MSRKQKLPFLALHYDKLVLAGSVVIFIGVLLAMQSGVSGAGKEADDIRRRIEGMSPKNPVLAAVDSAEFDAAMSEVQKPFVLSTNASFLVSPERVACIKCGQPIPLREDVCHYCGADQPSENVGDDWDTDGDGIPDVWEKKYGLNHVDVTDAALDADGDGFTNLEEFKSGTNPRDPVSHPPRYEFLRVSEVEATPFPYVLRGKTRQPDGGYKFQINDPHNKTLWVSQGDELPGTGFTLTKHEVRREMVQRHGLPPREQDVFYLTFERGEDFVELKENGPAQSSAFEVTFICTKDSTGASWHVKRLESFDMDGETFTLISVNPRQRSAVLKRKKTGETLDVPSN